MSDRIYLEECDLLENGGSFSKALRAKEIDPERVKMLEWDDYMQRYIITLQTVPEER